MTDLIYFVQAGRGGAIKVGRTSNIRRRMAGLQVGNGTRLRLLGTMPGGQEVERDVHHQLADHRLSGEWFSPRPAKDLMKQRGAIAGMPEVEKERGALPIGFVAQARAALKMTQQDLADALGLSQPSISRIENNPDELDARTRLAIRGLCAERRVKVED